MRKIIRFLMPVLLFAMPMAGCSDDEKEETGKSENNDESPNEKPSNGGGAYLTPQSSKTAKEVVDILCKGVWETAQKSNYECYYAFEFVSESAEMYYLKRYKYDIEKGYAYYDIDNTWAVSKKDPGLLCDAAPSRDFSSAYTKLKRENGWKQENKYKQGSYAYDWGLVYTLREGHLITSISDYELTVTDFDDYGSDMLQQLNDFYGTNYKCPDSPRHLSAFCRVKGYYWEGYKNDEFYFLTDAEPDYNGEHELEAYRIKDGFSFFMSEEDGLENALKYELKDAYPLSYKALVNTITTTKIGGKTYYYARGTENVMVRYTLMTDEEEDYLRFIWDENDVNVKWRMRYDMDKEEMIAKCKEESK